MHKQNVRDVQEKLKVTIDMVTKLWVYTLNTDAEISSSEISILYSLLTNLFAHVNVSWEAYVRDVIDSEYQIEEVLDYLNKQLSQFDKVRILQSLVILAKTEGDLRISEITELLDFCKKLDLNPEGFISLIDYFESGSSGNISVVCEHSIAHVRHSLFSDFVVMGSSVSADIRYRNAELAAYEMSLYAIDKHIFLGVGSNTSVQLDEKPVKPNSIILLHPDSNISLGGCQFSHFCLRTIYDHRDANDEIVFHKSNYDFIVSKRGLWYSLNIRGGNITLNGKAMLHNKRYEVYYDDTIQIRNYAPWNLKVLIENRSSIGLDDLVPKVLYIDHERDYFDISRVETTKSITKIELVDGTYKIHPPKSGWTIFVNQQKLGDFPGSLTLNSDIITMDKRNFRINSFYDLIETPFELQSLSLVDIKHYFSDGQLALDSISCEAKKGNLIGILGQSGCGKSTLVKVLSGEVVPTYGQLLVDGKDFFQNVAYYMEYIGYVPQDDLLYPYLSVYENLWYRLRLRMPNISEASLDQKINNILHQVNLTHQRDTKVGDFKKKNLSGGERKRLNIALELLFEPTIIICDEPTSGLSFTDAEQIVDILCSLTKQGKIVIITIHQPNSSIFRRFDHVMLMDMGGRMAYYGSPENCFTYFDEELANLTVRTHDIDRKKHLMTSDFMYDIITYPEYNEYNEPVYEQINKYIQPKRKFSPEYWRDKYKRKMLYEMIHHEAGKSANSGTSVKRKRIKQNLPARLIQMSAYISRSFTMKLRNRTNNFITFVQAPILGLIISFILRYTPQGPPYQYAENNNIGIFVFVSVIAFIFLGISNSIEEILDERKIILRESHMNLKVSFYQVSKLITLSFFVLVQAVLYQSIASVVLGIKGLFGISVGYLFLSGLVGISLGLLCSSFIKEKKAIINLLPLVLIPQIIFGGSVIEFERMNRSLTIYSKHPVPEIVQAIPSRWLFEGMATAYAKNTAFHRAIVHHEKKALTQKHRYRYSEISASEYQKVKTELYYDLVSITEKWNPNMLMNSHLNASVSLMDGEVLMSQRNMFLSSYKAVGGKLVRTWNFNFIVLIVYMLLFNAITAVKLKYYFKE